VKIHFNGVHSGKSSVRNLYDNFAFPQEISSVFLLSGI